MRVADIMRTDLVTALPETSVSEIVISLADAHISAVPVVDEHGRMLGVISASDVLQAEAEAGDATAATMVLSTTTARDLMTPMVRTIVPEATLKDAALRMLYSDVHRLFVTSSGRLVGVISAMDLVAAIATGRI